MGTSELVMAPRPWDISSSGVSWAAVTGGAFVAAALSLSLLALGAGFGLSAISPWSNVGASVSTIGTAALVWLVATQIIASTMGGYLAGRLRTRWESLHSDEVHFRDTANGFLSWAVAIVLTGAFLGTAAISLSGNAATAGAAYAAARSGDNDGGSSGNAYLIDRLFRNTAPGTPPLDPPARAEAARIFAHALLNPQASPADSSYLAQMIAAKTGVSATDASNRVSESLTDARQMQDAVRSASARVLLWTFCGMLIGAFCASFAATIGGRQRDNVLTI